MSNSYIANSFSDFDDFSQMIQAWDLDFRQLDSGDFYAPMQQLSTSNSLLTHVRFNRMLDQRGSSPKGKWTFALFSAHSTPIVWHEQKITTNSIVLYKPGAEIDCVSVPGFEVFALSYAEDDLNIMCDTLGLPEIHVLINDADCFSCKPHGLSESRMLLQRLVTTTKHIQTREKQTVLTHCLEATMMELVLSALYEAGSVSRPRPTLRVRTIQTIKEYLEAFPREPLSVSRLCEITGVSERTLQYAFMEQYGVSPKNYLKIFRLNGLRSDLLQSDDTTARVNVLASLWGFWHMGQLASDYRRLFGELPSETLKRTTVATSKCVDKWTVSLEG